MVYHDRSYDIAEKTADLFFFSFDCPCRLSGGQVCCRSATAGYRDFRMEKCLQIYREYRKNENQKQLAEDLALISLTPKDFQEIIDRFIYYRSRKSGMNQAMELLKAFRAGYDIKTAEVVSISGLGSEPFRLDAEILAVFEYQPDLIKQAFEG